MGNLTYLLGAGASAGDIENENPAIPILKNFNSELIKFYQQIIVNEIEAKDPKRDFVKQNNESLFADMEATASILEELSVNIGKNLFKQSFSYFIRNAEIVIEDLKAHITVDTLARKYYLMGSDGKSKLVLLKALLSVYFLHLQHNENRFDLRYDSLVATLLDRGHHGQLELPSNLKVISWNYDLQFEIALKRYQNSKLGEIQEQFGIHPCREFHGSSKGLSQFGMVKLNGTAGLFIEKNGLIRDIDNIYPDQISSEELFDLYFSICRRNELSISPFYRYSWENDNERFDKLPNMKLFLLDYAKRVMAETNNLVIIGYSFPAFNRKTDIELLNCLPQNTTIYIQDKFPVMKKNVEDIVNDRIARNIQVEFIEDISQFYIPSSYFENK